MKNTIEVAERVLREFATPLVVGGTMHASRAIGYGTAMDLERDRASIALDPEWMSKLQFARVRVARELVPLDRFADDDHPPWALLAALHDLVHATHPGFNQVFRRKDPATILNWVEKIFSEVSPPTTVGSALARHTWFARVLEIMRTDQDVSFWVGSRTFRGTDPPTRLLAWPDIRNVRVTKVEHSLLDLPNHGSSLAAEPFVSAIETLLKKTPLTDVATCARTRPTFSFTPENLALAATTAGRTLCLRALLRQDTAEVNASLGRAVLRLDGRENEHAHAAIRLLGERAIALAQSAGLENSAAQTAPDPNGKVARVVGARAALTQIQSPRFPEVHQSAIAAALKPASALPEAMKLPAALERLL